MAVDQIARMMALDAAQQGGGGGDSYTKAETDELLDGKADLVDGKVPASQLPSYVDDVLEYASTAVFPVTGESGKIYIATDTNKTYRWSGTGYVEISESLALGETASTAYAGNKGKENADAIAKKPGEITTGKQYIIGGQTITAGDGAEAFNDFANNKAAGPYSHAEGLRTTASANQSHAEGNGTTASGHQSHAEGNGVTASGYCSHAEGRNTIASGSQSHVEGIGTKASSDNQHVQGKFNVVDANGTYAFIIGNGTADNARYNAFAIDWNGLIYVNGAATGVDVSQLTPVTVDQTYDGTSSNPQSGVAITNALIIPHLKLDTSWSIGSTSHSQTFNAFRDFPVGTIFLVSFSVALGTIVYRLQGLTPLSDATDPAYFYPAVNNNPMYANGGQSIMSNNPNFITNWFIKKTSNTNFLEIGGGTYQASTATIDITISPIGVN